MPKFSLKSYLNYQKEQLQLFDCIEKLRIAYTLFGPHNHKVIMCYHIFGSNANLGIILTINNYFLFLY